MVDKSAAGSEAFLALSQFFVHEATLGDTLLRVSELACQVAGAEMAGITMLVEGRPRTGVFTDIDAPDIDRAQYETGEGPCLDAFRRGEVMRIDDTGEETRWPAFAARAFDHGVLSSLSMPIVAREESLGALNLYSKVRAAFDDEIVERVSTFAGHAAFALTNSQLYWDARQLNENLNQAMQSRATIDYAIGIIIASGGRTPEEAFQLLVRASQRENRKLRDIATEIVERAARRRGAAAAD